MSTPAYDSFAWFYNRYWNESFHRLAFPVVKRALLARLPERATILDAGCGTGYLAARLVERGFRVTGFDISPEMVRLARENVPGAEFLVSDARDFALPRRFHAAVATFDTLNHLLTPEDLTRALSGVARALRRGGLFLFDVLEEEAYQTRWHDSYAIVEEDHALAITGGGFDSRDRVARCRITMFRLEGGHWNRTDTTVVERCWEHAEMAAALKGVGFAEVTCHDARDLGMAGHLGAGRVFYVVKKSG
jgi:SAM-dependent methyltransferase